MIFVVAQNVFGLVYGLVYVVLNFKSINFLMDFKMRKVLEVYC